MNTLKQKLINGLYGCAVADAVGNPFEFKTNINPNVVIDYANSTNKLVISDDTQMTMFGFETMHNNDLSSSNRDLVKSCFTSAYVDWYETQKIYVSQHKSYTDCLLSFKSMWSIQAPGMTCLDSLESINRLEPVENDSMGCGSVMRLLPVMGFLNEYALSNVVKFGKITGSITHKHVANDTAIEKYIKNAYDIIHGDVPRDRIDGYQSHKVSDLGEGWIAPECVDMAILAYTQAETFDELLQLSISHDGDSDSVAAVAGSFWGLSGREVPQKYINKLDALDSIKYVINNYIE